MGDDTADERLQGAAELDLPTQCRNGKQKRECEGGENGAQIGAPGAKNGGWECYTSASSLYAAKTAFI